MNSKVYFIAFLFCGILMTSCQKESLDSTPISTETLKNTEAVEHYSGITAEPRQSIKGKKAPDCANITLYTEFMTVSFDEYEYIQDKFIDLGISLLAPGCNPYYPQSSSNIPNWEQKIKDAFEVTGPIIDDITFRINFNQVCYSCFYNPFCNFNNSIIHVILGNGCVIGEFVLQIGTNQSVELDLISILNDTCTAPC